MLCQVTLITIFKRQKRWKYLSVQRAHICERAWLCFALLCFALRLPLVLPTIVDKSFDIRQQINRKSPLTQSYEAHYTSLFHQPGAPSTESYTSAINCCVFLRFYITHTPRYARSGGKKSETRKTGQNYHVTNSMLRSLLDAARYIYKLGITF